MPRLAARGAYPLSRGSRFAASSLRSRIVIAPRRSSNRSAASNDRTSASGAGEAAPIFAIAQPILEVPEDYWGDPPIPPVASEAASLG